jgi:hypothetical protein
VAARVVWLLSCAGCALTHGAGGDSAEPRDDEQTWDASAEVEVWAGETRGLFSDAVCRPTWDREPFVDFELARVLLSLRQRHQEVSGTIRMGEGSPPRSPGDLPREVHTDVDYDPFWHCTRTGPTDGAEYTLLDGERRGRRLRFRIAPTELWSAWCLESGDPCGEDAFPDACQAPPACLCDGDGCRPNMQPAFWFDLQYHEGRLEGVIAGTNEVRLERVR